MSETGEKVGGRPARLGFLGVGWIGRNRMEAVLASGFGEACAICDSSPDALAAAARLAPGAEQVTGIDALISTRPDGVLVATPSALHANEAIRLLEAGIAVFCQKPLGRSAAEAAAVIETARRADRLLGVDMSYRHTAAMKVIRQKVTEGAIGRIFAVDLVFHNAYGPDKPWFYDATLSGGGCVIDLGVHLVDLLMWVVGSREVEALMADLHAAGLPLAGSDGRVEDHAVAQLRLSSGIAARLACSWKLHAGQDAVIGATFHGTRGSLAFANVDGSFYDFTADLHRGSSKERLVSPPDVWGGRAAVDWTRRLADGELFDPAIREVEAVAHILDRIYGR